MGKEKINLVSGKKGTIEEWKVLLTEMIIWLFSDLKAYGNISTGYLFDHGITLLNCEFVFIPYCII